MGLFMNQSKITIRKQYEIGLHQKTAMKTKS